MNGPVRDPRESGGSWQRLRIRSAPCLTRPIARFGLAPASSHSAHGPRGLPSGWLVLVETDSILLSAATFAIGSAPGIIAAPIGGAVADRYPRNRVLPVAAAIKAAAFLAMGLVAIDGIASPWPIFLLVAVGGVVHSFELPATQGLITDIVPRQARMNAISVQSFGTRSLGALGALAAGGIAEIWGIPAALMSAAASILIGGSVVIFVPAMGTAISRAAGRSPGSSATPQLASVQ